jgi:Sigma-70 region 2
MPILDSRIASRSNTRVAAAQPSSVRLRTPSRMPDARSVIRRARPSLRLKHRSETAPQICVRVFGKRRATKRRQRGIDIMQAQQGYIAGERNTVAHICEQHATQLQDAVSRYLPALYRRAYRYVEDPHDAEDAVQDALLSAYKHLDQFKGTAKMTTWLTTIVTNSALTQLRRRSRHPHASARLFSIRHSAGHSPKP